MILLGHSNGGTLITAVAERVPERLAHLVYLDAFLPDDGQATVDLANFPPGALEARARTEGFAWPAELAAAPLGRARAQCLAGDE